MKPILVAVGFLLSAVAAVYGVFEFRARQRQATYQAYNLVNQKHDCCAVVIPICVPHLEAVKELAKGDDDAAYQARAEIAHCPALGGKPAGSVVAAPPPQPPPPPPPAPVAASVDAGPPAPHSAVVDRAGRRWQLGDIAADAVALVAPEGALAGVAYLRQGSDACEAAAVFYDAEGAVRASADRFRFQLFEKGGRLRLTYEGWREATTFIAPDGAISTWPPVRKVLDPGGRVLCQRFIGEENNDFVVFGQIDFMSQDGPTWVEVANKMVFTQYGAEKCVPQEQGAEGARFALVNPDKPLREVQVKIVLPEMEHVYRAIPVGGGDIKLLQ